MSVFGSKKILFPNSQLISLTYLTEYEIPMLEEKSQTAREQENELLLISDDGD